MPDSVTDTRPLRRIAAAVVAALVLIASACGSDSEPAATAATSAATTADEGTTTTTTAGAAGIRLVSADEGAAIQAAPPSGLVVLDVRTPDEFNAGHLDGAVMVDFYEPDFAEQLAGLDRDVPYLLYCRSGNRSGQTAALMQDLGFTDVADVDGGIVAWQAAGHPVTG